MVTPKRTPRLQALTCVLLMLAAAAECLFMFMLLTLCHAAPASAPSMASRTQLESTPPTPAPRPPATTSGGDKSKYERGGGSIGDEDGCDRGCDDEHEDGHLKRKRHQPMQRHKQIFALLAGLLRQSTCLYSRRTRRTC